MRGGVRPRDDARAPGVRPPPFRKGRPAPVAERTTEKVASLSGNHSSLVDVLSGRTDTSPVDDEPALGRERVTTTR